MKGGIRLSKEKIMELEWPDLQMKVRAKLFIQEAPKICEAVWEALPFESICVHALISGQMFYNPTRIYLPDVRENLTSLDEFKSGFISFSPSLSSNIVIAYGLITEPMDQCVFASIIDNDLGTLIKVGIKLWDSMVQAPDPELCRYVKKPIKVVYRKKE
jgi:hypothetical protein